MAAGLLCCVDISLYYECTALDLQVDLGSHTYDQTVNWCCEQLFAHTVACSDRAVGHHHARCCAAARFFLLELDCICILLKKFTGLIIGGLRRRLRERERERDLVLLAPTVGRNGGAAVRLVGAAPANCGRCPLRQSIVRPLFFTITTTNMLCTVCC
jgi:hypothetical protein